MYRALEWTSEMDSDQNLKDARIFEKKESYYEHHSSYYQPPNFQVTLDADAKALTIDNSKPGMYVTARNLTVQVDDEKTKAPKAILKDLNFFLKPGTLTLLLGTPGCGKTTLMKTLANQNHNETISGTLRFNGKPANDLTHHRDVCYVVQEDLHMPSLSVKETLQFSADLQMNEKTTKDEKKKHIDQLLQILQLEKQADTVVGNQFLRGISGGQKKRVTIGVEMVKSEAKLYLMDEISTGLDSCTTLEIVKALKEKVQRDNIACIVSLLQPGSEITKLFDFLMILSAGHMVYFGPNSSAIKYFESYGFKLPLQHNPAEFYQEIVDEPELYYPDSKKKREKSVAEQWFMSMAIINTENSVRFEDAAADEDDDVPLRGTFEFAETYKESSICRYILAELDNRQPQVNQTLYRDSSHLTEYPTSIARQIYLVTKQEFTMMKSNPALIRTRLISHLVMGLILGSLYWQLSTYQTDGQNRSGLLFFALTFIIYGGFAAIPVLFESRDIFYIQRDGRYYTSLSFFLSKLIAITPLSFIESFIFSVLVYWMCGLQKDAGKFIYFVLMIFATNMQTQTFFRMISTFCPSAIIAAIVGPGIIAPLILFSGYMIAPKNIPGWWIYLYWISPIHYEFEGLMSNEHHGLAYHCAPHEMVPPLAHPLLNQTFEMGGFQGNQVCPLTGGDQFLNDLGMPQNDWFKWIDLLIVFGFCFVCSAIMYLCMDRLHFNSKVRASDSVDRKRVGRLQRQRNQFEQKKAYRQSVQVYQTQVELCHQLHKRGTLDQGRLEQLIVQQEQVNRDYKNATQIKLKVEEPKEVPRFRASSESSENRLVGCYVQWKNLSYEVDIKKDGKKQRLRLLDNINGFVKPGMLLALMGPSGAGKSTLLDVLANRKTGGHIKGEILINGKPRDEYFKRISGYVEQFDVLPPTQTVREAIQFSARTRLPAHKTDQKKMRFVESILDALNLLKIANRSIGLQDGLSLAQRKRINIGIELAADPQLLFLDEPTSGLDCSGALKVMKLIKRISNSGRSVICTIHQPSTLIFKQFDHLLLLKKGGETVYFGQTGENSKTVLNYFARYGLICDSLKNPADFILEVTDESVLKLKLDEIKLENEKEKEIEKIEMEIEMDQGKIEKPNIIISLPPNEMIPISPTILSNSSNNSDNNNSIGSSSNISSLEDEQQEIATKEILNIISTINDSCEDDEEEVEKNITIDNNNNNSSLSELKINSETTNEMIKLNDNAEKSFKMLVFKLDQEEEKKKRTLSKRTFTNPYFFGPTMTLEDYHPVRSFLESDSNKELLEIIDGNLMPDDVVVQKYDQIFASTMKIQFTQLLIRSWLGLVRRRTFIFSRIGRCFLVGIVFGTLFLQMELNQTGIYNRSSLLYFSLMLGGMIGLGIIPIVTTERGVFYRENASGMYRVWIYLFTFIITDIPWIFLSALAYTIPTYFLAGFTLQPNGQPFFYNLLLIFTAYLNFSLFCTFLGCLLPDADAVGGAVISVLSLYAGFLILPGSIPKGWKWFYHLDFLKYHLESLMINEFKDLEFTCPDNKGAVPILVDPILMKIQYFCPTPLGQYELDRLQLNTENEYLNLAVIFSFSIFFIISIYFTLRFIKHQIK
ncbi:ABC transporter G family protein [Cavenderia fasciculata]|uniref:ABC transporter G family protein n=1 Tax=Cavenderia fasciculata TaxID=261658 RepID=F4Q081_CACFS|nr:ABC transporter G family protein [Cavenderia fasciculata]EGG18232.1 ABC transporter G family protein [Cavenderia fasciculata]|eukprot:XP_004357055.1 ABC transporter G family protein [Cavenderia fasciculata]